MNYIQSGFLSEAGEFIKKMFNGLFNALNRLGDRYDAKVENVEQEEDNQGRHIVYYDLIFPEDSPLEDYKVIQTCTGKDKWDVEIRILSKPKESFDAVSKGVAESKLDEAVIALIQDHQGLSDEEMKNIVKGKLNKQNIKEINQSVKVTFSKIESDEDISVATKKICAATDPVSAIDMIESVMNDEEFVGQLQDGQTYEISDDNDSYDVCPCEECDCNAFETMLKCGYRLLAVLQTLHWNVRGTDFKDAHEISDQCLWNVRSDIDTIGEICLEKQDTIPDIVSLLPHESVLDASNGFDATGALNIMQDEIHKYVACIELFYCNFESDVCSTLDNIIRYWKHQADYLMKHMSK